MLLYVLIYKKNNPDAIIKTGIFPLQKATDGIVFLNKEMIDVTLLNEFTKQLTILIQNIFNPELSFEKTTELKRCEYCEFKNICQR